MSFGGRDLSKHGSPPAAATQMMFSDGFDRQTEPALLSDGFITGN
jgi:hypothetical protein